MQKIHQSIQINALAERVWEVVTTDDLYRQWTAPFCPGSYFKGAWETGSKMLFLGPAPNGSGEGGMVSYIKEATPYTFISIEHLGEVKDGIEDMTPTSWTGGLENYTFEEHDGTTTLTIDQDMDDSMIAFMDAAWKQALMLVKELSEKEDKNQ